MSLPTKKVKGEYTLDELRMILYGPPGIGKSTFAAGMNYNKDEDEYIPSAMTEQILFLTTEKAHKNLNIYKEEISCWEDFLKAEKAILNERHKFHIIVIDTIDNLYMFNQDYVGKKHKFVHPADLQYGKGWDLVKTEFRTPILRLSASDFGLIFVSHSDELEIITRGIKLTKTIPTMGKQARKILNPFVEVIGLCGFKQFKSKNKKGEVEYEERRVIQFEPSEYMEAKDRTGLLDPVMPLSWKQFAACFNMK